MSVSIARIDSLNHLPAILPLWFFARFRAFIVKVLVSFSKVSKVSASLSDKHLSPNSLVPRTKTQFLSKLSRKTYLSIRLIVSPIDLHPPTIRV